LFIQRSGVKVVRISFFSEYSADKVDLFDCFEAGLELCLDGVRRSEGMILDGIYSGSELNACCGWQTVGEVLISKFPLPFALWSKGLLREGI